MKIRTKLQVTFISVAFLLAISLMAIVYLSMETQFEKEVGDRIKDRITESAYVIDNFMFTREKDFNLLSNNPLFGLSSNETISNYLTRVESQYPFYEEISFVNTDAIILASSNKSHVGLNILDLEPNIDDEFYKTLKGGDDDVYISDIAEVSHQNVYEDTPLDIELLSNVIDLNGKVIGVLVGYLNLKFINDFVHKNDESDSHDEHTFLLNESEDVVISSDKEIKILQPHPDLSIKNLQQKIVNEEDGYIIYKNSKGIKVISGYADLAEYGTDKTGNWSLISTAPYRKIMAPLYQMLYKVIFAFIIILVVIFLLTIKFSRDLSRPIIKLQKAVSEFDLDSKPIELEIDKNDEVGKLSKSFNIMSKNIFKSSEDRKSIKKLLIENKNHLNNIINNIGDPVFVKDDQSRLLIVNDAFCKLFNLSKQDILGLTLAENVTEEERESFLKIDKQVIADGVENINVESLTISGQETRIITTKKTRYVDENGTKFLIGVIHDITKRKQTEEALFTINERNELISLATNDALWDWKLDTNIVWWNNGVTELFGHTLANNEATPDWWLDHIHPEDRETVEAFFFNLVNSDANFWEDEYRFKCHDGSYKNVYDRGIVRRDEQGKAYRMLGAMMDITERKKAEEALKASEELLRLSSELANVAAWEMDLITDSMIRSSNHDKLYGLTDVGQWHVSTFMEATHIDDREKCDKIINESIASGGPDEYNFDFRILYPDKSIHWLNVIGVVIKRDSNGIGTKLRGYITDITDRKEAQIALETSEEKYRTLFTSMSEGFQIGEVLFDENGDPCDYRTIEINKAYESQTGIKASDIVGKKIRDVLPTIEPFWIETTGKVVKTGESIHFEHYNDNTARYYEGVVYKMKEDYFGALFSDITTRKLIQLKLEESESNLRQSQIVANIGSYASNLNDNTWKSSTVLDTLLGINETFVKDHESFMNLIHPSDRELIQNCFEKSIKNHQKFNQEYRILKVNNKQEIWVQTIGELEFDEDGNPAKMIGTTQDITQRKRAEIELEIHKNNLEELVEVRTNQLEKEKIKAQSADLMKSAFLATMSHELRTPMNSIIGFTGILLKEFAGPVNKEQKKQLLMVQNSGQHLLGLINDVLDISKIEAGKLKVSKYPFSYLETLDNTVAFLTPQANKKGLQISTEFSETKVIINSDERRIEQVVLNLMSNAIKFSYQGTIVVKVAIKNNFLVTQIIDQGIGISKVDQNKLFMPFIQVNGGLARRHEGTGLGLAICKSLVEKLGGTIQVTSKLGVGSNFSFKLPI